jgi:acetyl esterase/lipase
VSESCFRGAGAALLAAALVLSSSGCAFRAFFRPSAPVEGGREVRDVAYWEGEEFDEKKHRLDIYSPKGEGPHPVVVFVHGGGWIIGDRQQPGGNYAQLGRRLASQGVVAMVISYRLAPWSRHPAQIRDTARALSWALHHAPEYGGDPTAVFAMGHSAGAHLVALASCDPKWMQEWGASPSQLAGAVTVSGPYDVEHFGRSLFIGGPMVMPTFGQDKKVWRDVTPSVHLRDARPPPFLVAWADGDPEILRRDGARFVEQLQAANVPVETLVTTFDDHLSVITDFGDVGNALGQRVLGFVQQRRLEVQQHVTR